MLAARKPTKTLILETTEKLLAEHGFESVSLRDITTVAEVNVAAVNYHFGSKEKLFEEIQCRYTEPVNAERFRRLEELTADGQIPTVRAILEAFMRPFLTVVKRSEMSEKLFFKLMGRCVMDPTGDLPDPIVSEFKHVAEVFTKALIAAAPGLSAETVLWRLHFTFGVMAQTLLHGDLLVKITDGACGEPHVETQFQEMIEFCHAGFISKDGGVR